MRLEVVVVPVSDADAAADDLRIVQLTPPGSACSIIVGTDVTAAAPGSAQGLRLVVTDIEAVRADLIARGAEVSEIFHGTGHAFHHAGTTCRAPGLDPRRRSYASFASFVDPDGNNWLLQEVTARAPDR